MTAITLDNTGDGGSVSLSLDFITAYMPIRTKKYAVKSIPGSSSPIVDADTSVKSPTTYKIEAYVTDTVKAELELLDAEPSYIIVMNDGHGNKNVLMTRCEFSANVGNTALPWVASIMLTGYDH